MYPSTNLLEHVLLELLLRVLGVVLRAHDDGVHALRREETAALLVLDRHLRLAVRTQPPQRPILAHIRQLLAQARGKQDRERHRILRLIRRVAEHDALVAGSHVHLVLPDVDAARDVRRLLVDAHEDLAGVAA